LTAEEDHDLLAAYVIAATIPRERTDRRKYPIYVGRIAPLGMDLLALEVEEALRRLDERGFSSAEIAAAFGNPTRILRAVHTFNEGLIQAGASKERRQALVLRLLRLAQELKAGDVLCRDGNNLVLSTAEAEELAREVDAAPAAPLAEAFQALAACLWSAAEGLYFACHGVAREQHGVYPLADGRALIVRDYRELAPADLWPDLPPLSQPAIRLSACHRPDPEVEWDVFNNLYLNGPHLAETLDAVAVTTEGRGSLPMDEVAAVTQELLALVTALAERIDSWDEHEVARQYLRVLWWQARPLKLLLEEDWRPPEEAFRRLDSTGVGAHSDRQPVASEIRARMDLL
jgi:hypothetical protein